MVEFQAQFTLAHQSIRRVLMSTEAGRLINKHGFQITDKHVSCGESVPVSLFRHSLGHMSIAEARTLLSDLGKVIAVADSLNSKSTPR